MLSYRAELIVPLLAKAFHEWFFQKPVYRNVKCPPFVAGTLADVPFVIVQTDGTKSTITISNYNRNASAPASTFEFDKTQVPQGTEVVDLR